MPNPIASEWAPTADEIGALYVETFDYNSLTTGIGDGSSDDLAAAPYSYTLR